MTLKIINILFKYQSDNSLDSWTGLQHIDGKLIGDCEDYCLTLQKLIPQFKEWDLYFCKINGNGHCVLYKNMDVIDCNTQKIVSFEQYCKMYKVTEFKKYNWFVVFSKILFSKAYVWIHSLKN